MAKRKTYDLDQIIDSYFRQDVFEDRMEYSVEDFMNEQPGMSRAQAIELEKLVRRYAEL